MKIEETSSNIPDLVSDANFNASTLISKIVIEDEHHHGWRGLDFKVEGDTMPTLQRNQKVPTKI